LWVVKLMHHKGVAHAAEQTMPFTKASLPPSISDEKLERDIEICQRAMQVCLLPRPQGRRTRCDARPTHGARAWADWRQDWQFGKLPQSVFDKIQASLNKVGPKRTAAGKSPRYDADPSEAPQGQFVLMCTRSRT